MKTLKVLLCATLLVWSVSGTARADTFVPGVTSGGGWLDVTQAPYGNLCWAASAANMLAYSGWNGGFATATDIFNEFAAHWNNEFGNPYNAIQWWFTGASAGSPAHTAGGGYYPGYFSGPGGANGYDEYGWAAQPPGVDFYDRVWEYAQWDVDNQRVFSMDLGTSSGGIHWLTGWGYDAATHRVWVTDSWTAGPAAGFWLTLTWDAACVTGDPVTGCWRTDYDNNNWFVRAMDSLAPNSGNIAPVGGGGGNGGVVPEPTSMLLLGTGLSGLYLRRRTRKK